MIDKAEKLKAGVRTKVEHPFRAIKRRFGFVKVCCCGLKKNTSQLVTLFALSNLYGARQIDGGAGMSAFANRARVLQSAKRTHGGSENDAISRDCS